MNKKQYAKDARIGKKAVSLFPPDQVKRMQKAINSKRPVKAATVYVPAKNSSSQKPSVPATPTAITSNFSLERVRERSRRTKKPFVSTPVMSQFKKR